MLKNCDSKNKTRLHVYINYWNKNLVEKNTFICKDQYTKSVKTDRITKHVSK